MGTSAMTGDKLGVMLLLIIITLIAMVVWAPTWIACIGVAYLVPMAFGLGRVGYPDDYAPKEPCNHDHLP